MYVTWHGLCASHGGQNGRDLSGPGCAALIFQLTLQVPREKRGELPSIANFFEVDTIEDIRMIFQLEIGIPDACLIQYSISIWLTSLNVFHCTVNRSKKTRGFGHPAP